MNGQHLHTKMASILLQGGAKGAGWVGGSVRFNPRRTMRDQGGREGNASDDALLKTWLTSVNKMDARDVHCYGRWRRPWFRCLVPRVESSPTPPPSLFPASMSLYESLWVAGVIARALFAHRFLSSCNKALVDAVTGPLRTGGHDPLSFRKEIETLLEEGGRRLDRLLDRSCEKLIVDC